MQFFKHRRTFLSSGSSIMQGAEILFKATVEIVGIDHCSVYFGDIRVYVIGNIR